MITTPHICSHFKSNSNFAPQSDFAGVQGAKQPLAYNTEMKFRYYMQAPPLWGIALDSVSR